MEAGGLGEGGGRAGAEGAGALEDGGGGLRDGAEEGVGAAGVRKRAAHWPLARCWAGGSEAGLRCLKVESRAACSSRAPLTHSVEAPARG